jgi:hypothetical protein
MQPWSFPLPYRVQELHENLTFHATTLMLVSKAPYQSFLQKEKRKKGLTLSRQSLWLHLSRLPSSFFTAANQVALFVCVYTRAGAYGEKPVSPEAESMLLVVT